MVCENRIPMRLCAAVFAAELGFLREKLRKNTSSAVVMNINKTS